MENRITLEGYVDRFWSRVDKKGPDDCWEWNRNILKNGYGQFWCGEPVLAHRFSYEAINGEGSARGMKVLHRCDNPPCCNPDHLFLGTSKDNMDDKHQKGRQRYIKGDECSWSKLTESDVKEIRELIAQGMVQRRIAEKYNVHPATICYINKNASWNHNGEIRKRGQPKGEECFQSKLNSGDVLKIKELISKGISQQRIANEFDISQTLVARIKSGRAWKHI